MNNYLADPTRDSGSGLRLRPAQLRAFRLAALAVLIAVAGAALLLTVVWGKEGFGREELPLCAAGFLVLAGAAAGWWLLCRRLFPPASGALVGVGLGLLAVPALLYAAFGIRTGVNTLRGAWLAHRATIGSYREAAILWPGFDHPVGLALELDLVVPARLEGNLLAPRLALGGPEGFTARDYFSTLFYRLEGRVLTQPVFQAIDPVAERSRLASGGPVHLAYRLYPGYVRRLEPGTRVCVDTAAVSRAGSSQDASLGSELAASWFFAGAGALTIDLSQSLTAKLRAQSRWAHDPSAWDALLQGLTPPALTAAGFAVCGAAVPVWLGERCWCRDAS
jgi:hypothetical protein